MIGRFQGWINTAPVSSAGDLVDEPALAWRDDLPARRPGPRARWEATPAWRKWLAVALGTIVAGPFAIAAAMVENSTAGAAAVLLVVFVAPLVEESVKGAAAIFLAESRPWLVPTAVALVVMTVVSGLVFAAVENVWYLVVLIDDPSERVVTIRWIFGPLVHGGGALMVGLGAASMWRRALRDDRPVRFDDVRPWIVVAAVWHGAYNGIVTVLEVAGAVS